MRPRDKAAVLVLIEAILVCGVIVIVRTAWNSGRPMFAIGFGLALLCLVAVWLVRFRKSTQSSVTLADPKEGEREPEVIDHPIDKVWLWLTVAASLLIATWLTLHFAA